jgi:hypothetical protein
MLFEREEEETIPKMNIKSRRFEMPQKDFIYVCYQGWPGG